MEILRSLTSAMQLMSVLRVKTSSVCSEATSKSNDPETEIAPVAGLMTKGVVMGAPWVVYSS
jgi:hypothetical protein